LLIVLPGNLGSANGFEWIGKREQRERAIDSDNREGAAAVRFIADRISAAGRDVFFIR